MAEYVKRVCHGYSSQWLELSVLNKALAEQLPERKKNFRTIVEPGGRTTSGSQNFFAILGHNHVPAEFWYKNHHYKIEELES